MSLHAVACEPVLLGCFFRRGVCEGNDPLSQCWCLSDVVQNDGKGAACLYQSYCAHGLQINSPLPAHQPCDVRLLLSFVERGDALRGQRSVGAADAIGEEDALPLVCDGAFDLSNFKLGLLSG